jgi:hypothetical protein
MGFHGVVDLRLSLCGLLTLLGLVLSFSRVDVAFGCMVSRDGGYLAALEI